MDLDVAEEQMWWRLKAGRGGVLEDDWLEQKIVTTGWGGAAGDYREQSPEEFRNGDPSDLQASKFVGHHDDGMRAGDVVVAYAPGKGHISGIGTVGEIQYNEDRVWRHLSESEAADAMVQDHYYWRPVTWFDLGTPVRVPDLSERFRVNGADQIPTPGTLSQFGTLSSDRDRIVSLVEEVRNAETVTPSGPGFGPDQEAEMQEWLAANIQTLGLQNARREFRTDVGRIDILAEDDNSETVIEVKRGRAGDRALGQLLGYMGARTDEVNRQITGILVAEDFTSRIERAVTALDRVSLYRFNVDVSIEPMNT
ncbi:endonuclease NucS domain-containing protein [Halobaculum gomorrense]|uniref:Endonuclease NucS C-terminal domain-containing protein n=1 Tax=Halobaculum gomorrense TaxID=43928 RepID=A0A1M5UT80_9EURY|nr:endonuclease NucS domain-containing protein [Halobaculum gomorrense]SHH66257.1 Protein of unknown function DUF91 [Halobaculum gomorrense]